MAQLKSHFTMSEITKLEQFIGIFKSEADLRVAVIGLLEHMPNTGNVRHTHGAQETGKDIVFDWTGPFGRKQLVSCVIKNTKISGAVESSNGARAVYIQAEQSLDTSIPDTQGIDQRVAQVFVISPYECPPA